jgi:putative hydrolase
VDDNVRAARAAGLEAVGITDHGPASLGRIGIRGTGAWESMRRDVARAARRHPEVRVLCGVEANVVGLDGRLDVPRHRLRELDIVLAGLHPQVWPASLAAGARLVLNNLTAARWSRRMAARARNDNTKALVGAVHRYPVTIVTHPGLKLSIDTAELARACARRGTAMEINSAHGLLTREYIELAAKQGATFAVSSDAHRPQDVGRLERGLALARAAGLRPEQVINARR